MNDTYKKWEDNVNNPLREFTEETDYEPLGSLYKVGAKDIQFEILLDGVWKTIKGTPRGYGYKFVMWEPFKLYKGLYSIHSEDKIRNIKWL